MTQIHGDHAATALAIARQRAGHEQCRTLQAIAGFGSFQLQPVFRGGEFGVRNAILQQPRDLYVDGCFHLAQIPHIAGARIEG